MLQEVKWRVQASHLRVGFMLFVLVPSATAGLMDIAKEITIHLQQQEYVPDSEQAFVRHVGNGTYQVTELFRAESMDNLEFAIQEGYPMPWLEEILNNESIPEEDRYWLDCRVRSFIAVELNTFFDAEGNSVEIDAEWIVPAGDYWRDNYIANALDHEFHTLPFQTRSDWRVDPGFLLDRNGTTLGNYTHTGIAYRIRSSRDGSTIAGVFRNENGRSCPVILYPDNTYLECPVEMSFGNCGVSQSGEYVIVASSGILDRQGITSTPPSAILLDRQGTVLWETELEMLPIGNHAPVVSPDDRYCSIVTQAYNFEDRVQHLLQVFSLETGEELWRYENPLGATVAFTPNSNFLCVSGMQSFVMQATTGEVAWTDQLISEPNFPISEINHARCSDNGSLVAGMVWPSSRLGIESVLLTLFGESGDVLFTDNVYGTIDISPNGVFVTTENFQSYDSDKQVTPCIVRRIEVEL